MCKQININANKFQLTYQYNLTDNCLLKGEDENTEQSSKNVEDKLFDEIIGHIEDILLGTY